MKEVQEFLTGRIWLKDQTPFPSSVVETLIQKGFITPHKGIQSPSSNSLFFKKNQSQCRRCGHKNLTSFSCKKCNGGCLYCRNCLRMGRVSSCSELITWSGPIKTLPTKHVFTWSGTLTAHQEKAAKELLESVQKNESHLVHAVCGAGKTELLFPAVLKLLEQGKRICVATPRTDVVLELAPRFRRVFPKTIIHALYGDSPEQEGFAQLVIATTHQLLRFEDAFDVVFIDEADAFPYTVDKSLQNAVQKAKKKHQVVHTITATPSYELIQSSKHISVISERFHGFPLPVPRFAGLWNYKKQLQKGIIPPKLSEWIEQCKLQKQPFLIFFPTIDIIERSLPAFQRLNSTILSVHAEDPHRKEKVMALRENKVSGLLTTTILERGITIPNVQVAVVGADEPIFTSSALIQIGGRVGRSIDTPDGDLVFFHHGISLAMDKAKKTIVAHNEKRILR